METKEQQKAERQKAAKGTSSRASETLKVRKKSYEDEKFRFAESLSF